MRAVLSGAIRKRIAPLLHVILSVSEKRFLVVIARHEVPRQSPKPSTSYRAIAKSVFSCHCEARSAAAIPQIKYVILSAAKYPTTKVESICPVSSSVGSFTPFRMTCKEKYVILSASEISHDQSEKYIPCGNPPSREIAAVVSLPRKDKKQTSLPPSGEVSAKPTIGDFPSY